MKPRHCHELRYAGMEKVNKYMEFLLEICHGDVLLKSRFHHPLSILDQVTPSSVEFGFGNCYIFSFICPNNSVQNRKNRP